MNLQKLRETKVFVFLRVSSLFLYVLRVRADGRSQASKRASASKILRSMATREIKQMEQARLAALRDFDDDDDPNQNRSAIDIGRDNVWQEQVAVQNADGTVAETAFDGFMRLGTNREILSWPGNSGETYLVKTEGDEAKAQARLKAERLSMRKNHQDYIAFKQSLEQQDRQRRDADFARRQRERVAAEEKAKAAEVAARRRAFRQNLHDWARVDDPGYGPDRWLWPKAYHHPRAYATPGGDIAIMKDSRNGSIASGVGAALGVPVDMSSWWSSWSKESSAAASTSKDKDSPYMIP